MSNVARKFSHTGPSQGALPLADRGRRISLPWAAMEPLSKRARLEAPTATHFFANRFKLPPPTSSPSCLNLSLVDFCSDLFQYT